MHISYKPLWHTLVERNMRKEDLRIAAGHLFPFGRTEKGIGYLW